MQVGMRSLGAAGAMILSLLVVSGCASSGKKPTTSVKALSPANSSGVLALNHDVQPCTRVAGCSRLEPTIRDLPGGAGQETLRDPRRWTVAEAYSRNLSDERPSQPCYAGTRVVRHLRRAMARTSVRTGSRCRLPSSVARSSLADHRSRVDPDRRELQLDSTRSSGATAPQDYK